MDNFSYLLFKISRFGITDLRVLRRYLWQFVFDRQSASRPRMEEPTTNLLAPKTALHHMMGWRCHKFLVSKEAQRDLSRPNLGAGFSRCGAHVRVFSGLKYFSCQKLVQSHRCVARDHPLRLMRRQRRRHEPVTGQRPPGLDGPWPAADPLLDQLDACLRALSSQRLFSVRGL